MVDPNVGATGTRPLIFGGGGYPVLYQNASNKAQVNSK